MSPLNDDPGAVSDHACKPIKQGPKLNSIAATFGGGVFPTTALNIGAPTHDKKTAADFLAVLDPTTQKHTYQFFADRGAPYAEIFHGTLDEVWPKVLALNTPERGVGAFITVNATDLKGRKRENIIRVRALWVDADNADQLRRCDEVVKATGATPTMTVRSSDSRAHFYWCCDDISCEIFSSWQAALIKKMGTDPSVRDLPRVMRLPGTLHLKDPNNPQLVTLDIPNAHT